MKIKNKPLDFRLGWAVLLFMPFFPLLFLSLATGLVVTLITLAYLLVAGIFFMVFVMPKFRAGFTRTPISMWYRKRSHKKRTKNGHNLYASLEAEIGEVFGIIDYQRPKQTAPPEIGRIDFYGHELEEGNPESIRGFAWDHRLNTDSAVIWVGGDSLLTQDPEEQTARFGGFSSLLESLSRQGSSISRFAWQDVTLIGEQSPEQEIARELARSPSLDTKMLSDYFKQTARMGEASIRHWTTFNISVDRGRTAHLAKQMGGPEKLIAREAVSFFRSVTGAGLGDSSIGVKAAGLLTHNDRVIDNRLKTDMVRGKWIHQVWERPADSQYLLDAKIAFPGSYDLEAPDHCLLGSTYYVNFYIEEFPQGGMPPAAFWELMRVPVPKVVSVVFEMLPPWWALQLQELRTTTAMSSNRDVSGSGYRIKEKHRVAAERAQALEAGLAESKGKLGRVRVYVSAAGSTYEEARSNAEQIQAGASNAPFYLENLTHRQDEGVNALLNVCRGLETTSLGELIRK